MRELAIRGVDGPGESSLSLPKSFAGDRVLHFAGLHHGLVS